MRHPAAILTMDVVRLKAVEYLADKRAIKDRFIQFGPIRNETDGRTVVIPASSAGKMLGASGVDIRRLAAAFDILFKKSLHVWTEPETDEPGHKRHPDVLWYHQYVCRFVCDMGEYFVRFAVKECRGQGGNAVHSSTITAVSMYKAQGARQPILEKTREKPMRLSLTISYHYSFPLSMGSGRSSANGGIS